MKIERVVTYYGYDLLINEELHKKCLNCQKWYVFSEELGCCANCIKVIQHGKSRISSTKKKACL
ncbi:hypothetical protein CEQ21_08695 [Niallia circulans]|uniref:Uncharacterized protein n=1 Tax=Niallia circulans TaxID=1397 RepID=A0A553SFD9_NIACI|nr:hypothetical protein CEQ21_08695 [Niallia circulans]